MKAEELVQRQLAEAKVAWKAEKNALQAEIIRLKEKLVGKAIGSAKAKESTSKPRTLEPGLKEHAPDTEDQKREKAAAKKK